MTAPHFNWLDWEIYLRTRVLIGICDHFGRAETSQAKACEHKHKKMQEQVEVLEGFHLQVIGFCP